MRNRIFASLVALLATSAACAMLSPPLRAKNNAPFVADKGSFKIMVNGQQAGKEDFEISPNGGGGDWQAHGNAEIQTAEGTTRISGTLQFHTDGTPVRYEWSTQGAKKAGAVITFSGSVANIELRAEGKQTYSQQLTFNSPQVAILDNNLYHQYAVLAGLYDRDKGGTQSFAVLVPQELTPGTVTIDSLGNRDVDGKKYEELRVKTEDLEVDLYLDGKKLMRIVAPGSNAEIIRQ